MKTSMPKTDHQVEGQEGKFSLFAGKKIHTTDQYSLGDPNREWHRAFHKEARVYIQELGAYSYVKLVERFAFVLSLRRLCDELECSYSWQPEGNPTQKARRPSRALPANSFPRRGHSAVGLLRLPGTTPPGAALCQTKKLRTPATFTRTFSQTVRETTTQYWSGKHFFAETRNQERPYCGNKTLFGCNRCGQDPSR